MHRLSDWFDVIECYGGQGLCIVDRWVLRMFHRRIGMVGYDECIIFRIFQEEEEEDDHQFEYHVMRLIVRSNTLVRWFLFFRFNTASLWFILFRGDGFLFFRWWVHNYNIIFLIVIFWVWIGCFWSFQVLVVRRCVCQSLLVSWLTELFLMWRRHLVMSDWLVIEWWRSVYDCECIFVQ